DRVGIDRAVVLFTAAVALLTSAAFGVGPALYAADTDVTVALKSGSATHTARARFLGVLVVGQVAVAFVLVAGAALLGRSLIRLTSVDAGFRSDHVLTVDVTLPDRSYPGLPEMRRFAATVLDRIRAVPSVEQAGAVNLLPIGGALLTGDFIVEGVTPPRGMVAVKPSISPEYFRAMGVPLRRGRDF